MKKLLLVLLLISFHAFRLFAQPAIEWQKCLGGFDEDQSSYSSSMQQTSDGGYIIAGISKSPNDGDVTGNHGGGGFDGWVVKLNADGTIHWQKSLGGPNDDYLNSVHQTFDGGYVVAGSTLSNSGDVSGNHGFPDNEDMWVVKLDTGGNIEWQQCLGTALGSEGAYCIQQTTDSGYIVGGDANTFDGIISTNHGNTYDYWVVKLDKTGAIQWQECLGGFHDDFLTAIRQTSDGGYIAAGYTTSNDGDVSGHHFNSATSDCWIVKMDSAGIIQWQNSYGGNNNEDAESIQQTLDGGYIVSGSTTSDDGDVSGFHASAFGGDAWIFKLDSAGILVWQKCLGGSGYDGGMDIKQTVDSGYIFLGVENSIDGDVVGSVANMQKFWVVKLDTSRTIQWQKCYGDVGLDLPACVQETSDGGVIASGMTQSNLPGWHPPTLVTAGYDFLIFKLSSDVTGIDKVNTGKNELVIYPNPSSGKFMVEFPDFRTIRLEITNLLGERIYQSEIKNQKTQLDLSNQSCGIYFVKINDGEKIYTKKIVIR